MKSESGEFPGGPAGSGSVLSLPVGSIPGLGLKSHKPGRQRVSVFTHSVKSDSLWARGGEPAGLLCPWDFPSKNAGVGHRFFL